MEARGTELGEGSGSNPVENVNAQLVTALTRMTEFFEKQETRIARLEQPILETADDVALERFQKFNPPKFDGEPDEEKAERWMETLEDIYAALRYTEERKVKFAVFQLEGAARDWWRIIDQKWDLESTLRTWDNFVSAFRIKFIPILAQEKKEEEFINLKQGNMTVVQYEAKFTKLSKYAPDMVKTEEKRKRRFLQGLTLEIQEALTIARLETYVEMVEMAQRTENIKAQLREYRKSQEIGFNKEADFEGNPLRNSISLFPEEPGEAPYKRPYNQGQETDAKRKVARTGCRHCGKNNHEENECWWKAGKCLKCGSPKHRIGACPMMKENPKIKPQGMTSIPSN